MQNCLIIGAQGTIGRAFIDHLLRDTQTLSVHTLSRQPIPSSHPNHHPHHLDYFDEKALANYAETLANYPPLDLILVATGILHNETIQPEKSLKMIDADHLQTIFRINTILPSLMAKHFTPRLHPKNRAIFAALSARVGSIEDNRLGGWYAYRASKAALNMMIKTMAIELQRFHPNRIAIGLHPGTVVSPLSDPFQQQSPSRMTPEIAVKHLMKVLDQIKASDHGHCFAWDGQRIPA